MNEYQIAIWCGVTIAALWLVAYILCWIGQWAWAWVDDDEIDSSNWLAGKIHFSKWKYPVYNNYGIGLEEAVKENKKPFGYAKDKKHENKSIGKLTEGVDYKYSHSVGGGIITLSFLTSLLPILFVVSLHFYPIVLAVLILATIAWVARFSRRHKKLFDKHIQDKDAHS